MEKINSDKSNRNSIKNISLNKIGNSIKEARINSNQSLNELASFLKISEQQLRAIEEGRDDLLPEKVFVKAMVKKISEKLKLDTQDLMAEFNLQKEQIKNEEIVESKKDIKKVKSINLRFLFNILISGLIGFLASSLIFNLFFNLNNESDTKTYIKNIK